MNSPLSPATNGELPSKGAEVISLFAADYIGDNSPVDFR
jgi:hypothetical protein